MSDVVRLAVPSKGRLFERSAELLRRANIDAPCDGRSLASVTSDGRIEVIFVRPADIPSLVAEHAVDLGITGQDRVSESNLRLHEVLPLQFGNCRLCVIVSQSDPVADVASLNGKRVATSYPHLTQRYFAEAGVSVHVMQMSGSLEAMIGVGAADVIVDIVETGRTLRDNGLRVLCDIEQFSVVVIAGEPPKDANVSRVVRMLQNALVAQEYSLIEYNLLRTKLAEAEKVTPGFTSPTVSPLEDEAWCAVKVMVKKPEIGRIFDELEAIGAVGILETQIQSCRL